MTPPRGGTASPIPPDNRRPGSAERTRLRDRISTPEGKRRYVRASVCHHRRPLRLHHQVPVLRPGSAMEAPPRTAGADHAGRSRPRSRLRHRRHPVRGPQAATQTRGRCRSDPPHARAGARQRPTRQRLLLDQLPASPIQSLSSATCWRCPLRSGDFDVVTIGYGLRNVPQLHDALREIHRVLAPGGRLLSLDFNRPANAVVRGVYLAYLTVVGSALGLRAASRSGYVSLHTRIDQELPGRHRHRATARG